ncbi:OmpA family protein [Flavobacterium sp. C4GT6]|uniref:OmpA family protein n=1 Tax=Flavobacterium sp. C4GT6 TaxID=3103818 RepID=UPI002ED1C147
MKNICIFLLLTFFTLTQAQQKHTIYFDLDIDEPNSSSVSSFDAWLKQNKDAIVFKVYGYADKIGSVQYNRDLSLRRASDIVNRLKQNNIDFAEGFEIKGFGEQFEQDSEQAKNRKVEVYYELPETVEEVIEPLDTELAKKVDRSKVGDKLKLPNLYFYNNSDIVVPKSKPLLRELLVIMQKRPKLKIEIQGHICCQPTDEGRISYYRAKAVYEYLLYNGIDGSRLKFRGFSSNNPVYPLPEKNEDERNANRRVEIEIIEN